MTRKNTFDYFLMMLICLSGYGQNTKDAGLWATFSVQKEITKKISLTLDQEMRLRENFQRLNLFYTNIGIDYKLNKNIKISPTYRFTQKKQLEPGFGYRHRFMLDVTAKKKFSKITLSERVRYQTEVQDFYTSRKGKIPEHYLRFKTDLKYTAPEKLTPYISCELRYQITAPRGEDPLTNYGFHRIRNVAGIEYKINDSNTLNLYYLIQSEFNITNKESIYIVGIGYNLSI
jgi:Protein of unknown function (DUF2490)